jgi:hypothetical protein
VGVKTANIVLLFSFGMPAFPVDTHVLRVTKRLGLVPGTATLAKAALSLEPHVGTGDHGPLHLNLIRLGREVCRPRNPLCAECPLLTVCPEGKRRKKACTTGGTGGAAAGGGRSEVKRSRAGSPHGEPRTESPSEAAQPKGKGCIPTPVRNALPGVPRRRKNGGHPTPVQSPLPGVPPPRENGGHPTPVQSPLPGVPPPRENGGHA